MINRPIRPGCPDCSAAVVNNALTHVDGCPHGAALDEVVARDREWFRVHPGAQRYTRPVTPTEALEWQLTGQIPDIPGGELVGEIEVEQIRPGYRTRRLRDAWIALVGDAEPPGGWSA